MHGLDQPFQGKGSTTFHLLAHHKGVVDQFDLKTTANEFFVKFESRKLRFELGSF